MKNKFFFLGGKDGFCYKNKYVGDKIIKTIFFFGGGKMGLL
jgi:hypothetical protein